MAYARKVTRLRRVAAKKMVVHVKHTHTYKVVRGALSRRKRY